MLHIQVRTMFTSQNEYKEFLGRHRPLTLRADVSSNWAIVAARGEVV